MKKKEIPLTILHQINHFKTTFPGVSKIVKAKDSIIRYEDADEDSDFFFQINKFSSENGIFSYTISYKPNSADDLGSRTRNVKFEQLNAQLEVWGNTIKAFNETEFFIDDPITKSYAKEFYDEYRILEEDADKNPFELKRQILIDLYLENSIKLLEKYELENSSVDLTESKAIAIELKSELTQLTKNQVMLKLSKFWAVTRKKGIPIFKEIFLELAKEIVKEIGKKMLGL